jgi:hypothetical protein
MELAEWDMADNIHSKEEVYAYLESRRIILRRCLM